jgi:Sulfotransferase family
MKLLSRSAFNFWLLKQKARMVINRHPLPGNYKRIYHFHIRKSAGTSINAAMWGLAGKNLQDVGRSSLIVAANYVFVRHNRVLIERGNYTFANSHAPFWELSLPVDTYSFTVFRDPVARLYSLYRYYHFNVYHPDAALLDPMNESVKKYEGWLGNSFTDFLDRLPAKHLQNQLYMFSESFNIEEAFRNIKKLNGFFFQDELNLVTHELGDICGRTISLSKSRIFPYTVGEINEKERDLASVKLQQEIELYRRLKSSRQEGTNRQI